MKSASVTATATAGTKPIIFVDIGRLIPYHTYDTSTTTNTSTGHKAQYDDTHHFTASGYDVRGRIVYDHIKTAVK